MPREITATVFNESAYAPYGGLIAKNLLTPRIIINNGGTSQKSVEVVPTENLYAAAPSGKPGKAIVNVSVCSPRPTTDDQNGTRRLRLDMLERHPYTTQVFVPMGARVRYLVVVADSAAGGDGPALETIKAFVAGDGQGVCYGAGVFHAAMSVVGEVCCGVRRNVRCCLPHDAAHSDDQLFRIPFHLFFLFILFS